MKTVLLMLAASLIRTVGQSRVDLDANDIGIDDETGRALLFLADELTKLASGQESALMPAKLREQGTIFEEPTPADSPPQDSTGNNEK